MTCVHCIDLAWDRGRSYIFRAESSGAGQKAAFSNGDPTDSYAFVLCFFFQAEDGIRDLVRSRGLGDVYKRQTPG